METGVQEVAENIYEFQVPIPFKLRDINLYLVKDDDGCLLVDTGTNTPATAEALQANLAQLGVSFADLRYVVDRLSDFYTPEETRLWLHAKHALLAHERAIDLIHEGRTEEVLAVIERLEKSA